MSQFRYSALAGNGQTISGIRQAPDPETLATELMEQGLVLLRSTRASGLAAGIFAPSRRAGRKELRDFTQHMATCLGSGITAVSAIDDFLRQSKGYFREVLSDIRNDVSSGTPLDGSFARHPEVFPPVYLALVAAGQHSGGLAESFQELVAYLEWSENLRAQTSQAMIYPSILAVGILGLFMLMMLFVLPRFTSIFEATGMDLPTLTVKVMALGKFVGRWWWLILGTVGTAVVSLKMVFATAGGAYWRDRMLLKTPVVGSFLLKIALSRFAKTFAMIFGAGVDLMRVLDLLRAVVGNRVLARELAHIRQRVASGESLTTSFAGAPVFPALIQRLIAVGEKTGSLDTSLMKASEYLDKEIPRDLKKAFTIFEAVIIAVLGVLVCVAALSLLMPIMSVRPKV